MNERWRKSRGGCKGGSGRRGGGGKEEEDRVEEVIGNVLSGLVGARLGETPQLRVKVVTVREMRAGAGLIGLKLILGNSNTD